MLPFHALRGADGRYLVEAHGVTYVPSLTVLRLIYDSPSAPPSDGWSAFVAGVAAQGDAHPEFFEHDDEVLAAAAARVSVCRGPRQVTPDRVLAGIAEHDLVHLTCHGFYDETDPLRSGLMLGDGTASPPRTVRSIPPRARHRFLATAEDVLATRTTANIVTLRACSTGLVGERNAGDEFDGLTRSFLQAGARSVLAGQWNVDQRSSRRLVQSFYRAWLGTGAAKWQALRAAQLELLTDPTDPALAHPYHWAALSLLGDWR
ncbi:CHAT domain-containing protein [Dactylosporangium sp. NPDC051541]|uniref:CHAT domain-containing protein n=1 Tax=Dactylosporangium sp. NPDC051541 TaxID=3363977 RepID=UPI0037A58BF1